MAESFIEGVHAQLVVLQAGDLGRYLDTEIRKLLIAAGGLELDPLANHELAVRIDDCTPKAIIAAYLSFFPVLVSMVKGLRSPDQMQLDLLKTYGANGGQTLGKLRVPSSMVSSPVGCI